MQIKLGSQNFIFRSKMIIDALTERKRVHIQKKEHLKLLFDREWKAMSITCQKKSKQKKMK